MSDPASPSVPAKTLAGLFSLTEVRIQQLAKAGVIKKVAHGRYDLWASIKGYVRYLQDRSVGRGAGDGEGSEYNKHRARLFKARADEAEMRAAIMRGDCHDAEAVRECWLEGQANFRARLLGVPSKGAQAVEGMSTIAERKAVLEKLVHEALNELSDYDAKQLTERWAREHAADVSSDVAEGQTSAESDAESVV